MSGETRHGAGGGPGRVPGLAALDRALGWGRAAPTWAAAVVIGALLATIWLIVAVVGGAQSAATHLFYVPILLAVVPFGLPGALVTAVAAGVLAGPTLPIDAVNGEPQALLDVLVRGSAFVLVGAFASVSLTLRQRLTRERTDRDVPELVESFPAREAASLRAAAVAGGPALIEVVVDILRRQAFSPVFQPVYSLHNGELVAIEALTRFDAEPHHPPDVWFAVAELAGVGADLELAAIKAAIEATTDLPDDVSLSVNASPATLGDPRLHELLAARHGRSFTLELTEHAVVQDYDLLEAPLAALRAAGVMIAVDDAGAGFASLQHIVRLAPDVIKLDISLTQDVGSSAVRRALGGALVEFVHRTGAMLIVEGIEDDVDLCAWSELGADAVQGYLVGRPGPLTAGLASPIITALLDSKAAAPGAGADMPAQRSLPVLPVGALRAK